MTLDEFRREFKRLCDGWKFEPTPEQVTAFQQRLIWAQAYDWQRAVDATLANYLQPPRSGLLDVLLKAVEEEASCRRKQRIANERAEAGHTWEGRVSDKYDSPEEHAYAQFRLGLLRGAMGQGPQTVARCHTEGLAAWIAQEEHARWAQQTPQGDCGCHDRPHTLLHCLTDEMQYWMARAAGQSEAEARRAVSGVTA